MMLGIRQWGINAANLISDGGGPLLKSGLNWSAGNRLWPSKVGTSLLVMKVLKLTHALKCHLKNTQYDQDELKDESS